ncbi:leucyl/phenylalanyl-tRNA--protein transferase [Flavicella sp.]|uniref:leucyl/phenylalanyl-tRNA--protein transferase n=1 Tax=Flavicella sp. TaxID=2957742 RepID=UPI0026203065|nr:leucyl/phenylalanyl-tRNA--protein transferase [Flavicella sp.]MDG1804137.1 leucyl/phenylalanyl-tRNA--protein transferase [Flavicella sp.]
MWLSETNINFPDIHEVTEEGILALGGDLKPERLLKAYQNGIFPWYSEGEPIIWYCPDPRMVLFFDQLKISKSMRSVLKKDRFKITYNQNFEQVIANCKTIDRNDGLGTWITNDMQAAYIELHKMGIAKSVEVWQNDELVGGLYGIDLGNIFCGESMFSKVSNASKTAFIHLAQKLEKENYQFLDCQVYNDHLASLGAEEISRETFLHLLKTSKK